MNRSLNQLTSRLIHIRIQQLVLARIKTAYLVNVFVSVSRINNRGNQLITLTVVAVGGHHGVNITLTAATNPRPTFAEPSWTMSHSLCVRTAMCTHCPVNEPKINCILMCQLI